MLPVGISLINLSLRDTGLTILRGAGLRVIGFLRMGFSGARSVNLTLGLGEGITFSFGLVRGAGLCVMLVFRPLPL